MYYIYVLLFGAYVSIRLACGAFAAKEKRVFSAICPVLLILQGICLQIWGIESVRMLYPLIAHLPIVLIIRLALKRSWNVSLISVIVSYSMCQILRWIGLAINAFEPMPIVSLVVHLALCHLFLLLLNKHCLRAIHNVISRSSLLLSWFGALPLIYYLYEYFMLYTQQRYAHILAFNELLPTGMVLFFILFVIAYQRETEKREQAEYQAAALEMELSHAEHEISVLRTTEEQTAIYRHDLRHHLTLIDGLLSANNPDQIKAYIRRVVNEIETIVPVRYCENETINLLLCAYKNKAETRGVPMSVKTSLPKALNLPDTELCAMLSNGLENALNAASLLTEGTAKFIDIFCGIKQNNMLIEIKNPYEGEIIMQNGIPQAKDPKRHYGCLSIQSIVQRRKGVCSFETSQNIFILRIAIPLESAKIHGRSLPL